MLPYTSKSDKTFLLEHKLNKDYMWNRFEIIDLLTENRNRGIVEIDLNMSSILFYSSRQSQR